MTRTESLDLDSALGPQQEVRLPGGTVRYRERGAGPPVLFVHGLLVNGALWRKVVPELAPQPGEAVARRACRFQQPALP